MTRLPLDTPSASRLLRLDNLLIGALILVALGWATDSLGCRFGYRLGVLTWLYGTLEPLGLAISVFCVLVGLVLVAFRKNGLAWLLTGGGLLILPRLLEGYAPVACAVWNAGSN
jgi:hypothetical protein